MRVLALTRYGPAGPSSRYRYYQYLPYLKKEGFDISVSPFFNKKYIYNLYSDHHTINFINPFTAYMKRTSELLFHRSYDLVWMEKEAIPWIPAYLEKFLYNNSVPFVIDYDDAIYHRYDQHRNRLVRFFLSTKIEKIMSSSTVVVAGNKYIADYALKAGAPRVEIFPTVVDLSKYKVKKNINPSSFTIGWIGSPSTSRHINIASEALNKLCKIKIQV